MMGLKNDQDIRVIVVHYIHFVPILSYGKNWENNANI